MKTKIYTIDDSNIDPKIINEAGNIIKRGGLVAFPTETVYGLGGDALNADSANQIYAAKGRPADNPLIIHLCRITDITTIAVDIPESFYLLAEHFWAGPLTMILKKSSAVPASTTGGLNTVAVRMPNHRTALELIKAAGGFVAAPSANLSGRPSPTISKYVAEDMDGRIDMIIDGGETRIGLESTIIDLSGSKPEILRPGFVTKEMIENVIGSRCAYTVDEDIKNTPPRAPGMKYRHYAPKGLITVVIGSEEEVVSYINEQIVSDRSAGKITGVIATEKTKNLYSADRVKNIGDESSDEEIAHNLYRILREFDDEVTDVIYSEGFNISGIGQATMNRLLKAASNKIIEVR